MKTVLALFEFDMTVYVEIGNYLSALIFIIHSPTFEPVIVKVHSSMKLVVIHVERHVLRLFEHGKRESTLESSTTLFKASKQLDTSQL